MKCPKCHSIIDDNQTVCPTCHKVLLLECPNCHSLSDSATCSNCGYSILIKCAKCSKLNPAINDLCTKCGFPTATSLAYQECESDEFASVIIQFKNLNNIRRLLKSKELYQKFFVKLKNMLLVNIKSIDGKFITYGNTFVVNMNKELSFATSANKAVRFALKLTNTFTELNNNIYEELRTNLGLNIRIQKKEANKLQELTKHDNNVKLLNIKKETKNYLKGSQIILDQYTWDEISKDYKTDSLYSVEENGKTITFYEILLDSYIVPPSSKSSDEPIDINKNIKNYKKSQNSDKQDLYAFKVFDINAKCSFITSNAISIKEDLNNIDFLKEGKLIALRSKPEIKADINDIVDACKNKNYKTLTITCTPTMNYKAWGFFEELFRKYFSLPINSKTFSIEQLNKNTQEVFKPIINLCKGTPIKSMSPEDARFTFMELWNKFLSLLKNTVIIVDGFENLDDTSIQTLSLYFDKFKKIIPNFIFITTDKLAVHSKFKNFLQTNLYTEFNLVETTMANCISTIKADASDFIGSFYYEKINENFNGSYLYFKNAIEYLKEVDVLMDFENKLLIKTSKSVVLPTDIYELYKARINKLDKNKTISLIFAYSGIIAPVLDYNLLENLGVENLDEAINLLKDKKFITVYDKSIEINNYIMYATIINNSIKNETLELLSKSILEKTSQILDDCTLSLIMGNLKLYKEEYNSLALYSNFAMLEGDYDAYLKDCLGFLSIIESVETDIPIEEIEKNKAQVYNSILMCLYSYAPAKIYFIENLLLMDAISANDDDKIVKLSNLMLQGALISSNYTDALGLLHNILSRMKNPTLIVNGVINTKFLLLSLVNIEILYNIGNYKECVEVSNNILSILKPEIIEKIKPASFSINLFVSHLLETFRLSAFAKLHLMDSDIEEFFDKISLALNTEFPEKDCIIAIKDYLAGRVYITENVEKYSAFSKLILLILQEFSTHTNNFSKFAQNIYQAKLLAADIHQKEIELFCDLLIGYSYAQTGIKEKAHSIYSDILKYAEESAIYSILILCKYFIARLEYDSNKTEQTLIQINDTFSIIQKNGNQSPILYTLLEKFYVDIAKEEEFSSINIENEEKKLANYTDSLKRIVS